MSNDIHWRSSHFYDKCDMIMVCLGCFHTTRLSLNLFNCQGRRDKILFHIPWKRKKKQRIQWQSLSFHTRSTIITWLAVLFDCTTTCDSLPGKLCQTINFSSDIKTMNSICVPIVNWKAYNLNVNLDRYRVLTPR